MHPYGCQITTYTVNVRKPDVRFGKPDEKASGFQHVQFSDVRFYNVRFSDVIYKNTVNVRNPDVRLRYMYIL